MPREPFTSTRSPGRMRASATSAASSRVATGTTASDRQAGSEGGVRQRACRRTAHRDQEVEPGRRSRATRLTMERFGVRAELEHLAEHGDLAGASARSRHGVEHLPQRRRTGVVRIVDERDAPGQPEQLAAMRRRLQTTRGLYDLRHRNFELDRDGRRGQHIRQVAQAEERRDQRGRTRRRLELGRRAVETAVLDVRRSDIGCGIDAECHDLAEKPLGPGHDPRIVGVGDEHVLGVSGLENFGFRVGNRLGRLEEAEMGVANIGPHADVRFRDADQRANLSRMVHAQLDDSDLRPGPQLEQRERQTDVVVEIPLVPEDAITRRQKLRGDFLGRRLSGTSGDRHDPGARPASYLARDVLQAARRVIDSNHHPGRRLQWLRLVPRQHDGPCPARHRFGDEVVPVEPFAPDRYETISRGERPRIDHDPSDRRRPDRRGPPVPARSRRRRPRSARAAPRAMAPETERGAAPGRSSPRPRRRRAARDRRFPGTSRGPCRRPTRGRPNALPARLARSPPYDR